MQQEPVRVAILVFPASTASIVHGLYDLFHAAGRDYESMVGKPVREDLFEPRIVAARSGAFSLMNGLTTTVQVPIAEAGVPDIICVPEVVATPEESMEGRFEMEMDWLRRCNAQGSILASACTGALLLAEAGLLDEHEGTTHWAFCDVMQQRHPRVRVRPKSALVMAGEAQRLVMAGGGTSWLDLALYLIARKAGWTPP